MTESRKKLSLILFTLISIISFITDYASKQWALKTLTPGAEQPFLGDFITLKLHFNPGAAFSFLVNSTWIFTIFALVIILGIAVSIRKLNSPGWAVALGLMFGGAIGNFIDRLTQPPAFGIGHVVDFLNWNNWFIGNVADIWIVVAAGLIFVLVLLNEPFNGIKETTGSEKEKADE
ncbi:signal peptidase II [Gleimia coleocanis DSM 15436]|uniref:Lipoprotein signal peptidase n=1 Tax=Gleimia coleocanis DSM 15436 TaxID=525245 RepID=C0VZC0_9ACTO|nr:signal peptidase II [Gleimia coleocanis]EEH64221.1 signal peptidase II [Gleimia coleocanis DSM 15436]